MKHTQGPWELGDENNESAEVALGDGLTISLGRDSRHTSELVISRDEMLANAQLIMAAPDLLDALELAMDFINKHPADPDITEEQTIAWLALLACNPEKVIAKAKGESR